MFRLTDVEEDLRKTREELEKKKKEEEVSLKCSSSKRIRFSPLHKPVDF